MSCSIRFTPEERAKRPATVHTPFGFGPRNCVGMRFALLEAKIALMELLKRYTFVRAPDTEVGNHTQHLIVSSRWQNTKANQSSIMLVSHHLPHAFKSQMTVTLKELSNFRCVRNRSQLNLIAFPMFKLL